MKWLTFILLFTMSAFALGETLLRSAARRRLDALTLTVTAPTGAGAVRMTGPWWGWDPSGGPEATDNGDGTWTVTLDPTPTENMEYLWVVDGVQENLIGAAADGDCAAKIGGGSLITDYWSWANRVWVQGSGDAADTYDSCAGTSTGGGNGDDIETGDVAGCTDEIACNFDDANTDDDGTCTYAESGYYCDGICINDADGDQVCDENEVAGCTDEIACNFDDANTDDDGSCTYAVSGYDCDGICLADEDEDGVCDADEVAGCTDDTALNYNADATDDDGSCLPIVDTSGVFGEQAGVFEFTGFDQGNQWAECYPLSNEDYGCNSYNAAPQANSITINYGADGADANIAVLHINRVNGGTLGLSGNMLQIQAAGATDVYVKLEDADCYEGPEIAFGDGTVEEPYNIAIANLIGGGCINNGQSPITNIADVTKISIVMSAPTPAHTFIINDIRVVEVTDVSGCTDPDAENFDSGATTDDSSCTYPAAPTVPAAPIPTEDASTVLSIFSTTYGNLDGTDFNPMWGQTTTVAVGDNLVYTNLNYQGTAFTNSDVSGYAYLHVDYYVVESTALNFFLIGGGETSVALDVATTEQWISVDIPLTDYSSVVNLFQVIQFKVDGNGAVAFNNIYFGGTAPVDSDDTDGDNTDVEGCMDANADNYNADATVQALDQYGNLVCIYASCDVIPDDEGCIYADSYSAFNEDLTAAVCSSDGGTACPVDSTGPVDSVSVTFQVDMTAVTTHPDGVYVAGGDFGQDGYAMTDAGYDVWSVTVELAPNARYLYKFRNQASDGNWNGFEDAAGLIDGECNTGTYNDRFVDVADDITLDVVAYGSCTTVPYEPPAAPTVPAAPIPTEDASTVLSIFSTTYGNLEGTDFNPMWGQTTTVAVGDNLVYTNLNYQGTAFTNSDVSGYAYLHVDYYVVESTALNFFLIGGGETSVALDVATTEQWISVDIPLTDYSSVVNLFQVIQFKVDGNGAVAFNNIYFGGTAPVDSDDTDGDNTDVVGCTDDTAANYNPLATDDDGSCIPVDTVEGCMDANADNYNADATVQALDQYGNLVCIYASCDVIPDDEGCIYADSYSAFNEDLTAAVCSSDGGTACPVDSTGPVDSVSVTFQVDMTAVTTHPDGVYVAGGDFGQDGYAMTDAGYDVWSVTVELAPNARYLYKFRNQASDGNWNGFEDAAGLIDGECNTGTYNDRFVDVADDITLDVVAYGSCTETPYEPPAAPTVPAAPIPTEDASTVLSIFSTTYGNLEGTDFNPMWGQTTTVAVGDNLVYTNLNYQGTAFTNSDVSGYAYLHVDYYVVDHVDYNVDVTTALNFFLISGGETAVETAVALDVATTEQWISVDIPLTDYSSVVDLADVFQFKVDGNGQVAFNNIYFGGTAPVDSDHGPGDSSSSSDCAAVAEPGDAVFSEAFGGADIGNDNTFTFPTGAEDWAGFSSSACDMYALQFTETGRITFTGSVASGGSVDVRFRLEYKPHPDTEPSYDTVAVTVDGATSTYHTVAIPSQGDNTFSNLIMYVVTPDVAVTITNTHVYASAYGIVRGCTDADAANYDENADVDDGSCWNDSDEITVYLRHDDDWTTSVPVVLISPNWCPTCGTGAVQDGEVWRTTVPRDSQYKFGLLSQDDNTLQMESLTGCSGVNFVDGGSDIRRLASGDYGFLADYNACGSETRDARGGKWEPETQCPAGGGDACWHNNELQYYTDKLDNSFTEAGTLKIVAKKESGEASGFNYDYTSARLKSTFEVDKDSYVEFRARFPTDRGLWPALWLLGPGTWPAGGEIDVLEIWNHNPNVISSAMHTEQSSGNTLTKGYRANTDGFDQGAFHTYAVYWVENRLVFSVDGVSHYEYKSADPLWWGGMNGASMNIIMNLAVDKAWVSADNDMTNNVEFEAAAMEVDYARVYDLATGSPVYNADSSDEFDTDTFDITASSGIYFIDGVPQKTLRLKKGATYTFDVSAVGSHPFKISEMPDGTRAEGTEYDDASDGSWTVPAGAPDMLYYYCSAHDGMGGEIILESVDITCTPLTGTCAAGDSDVATPATPACVLGTVYISEAHGNGAPEDYIEIYNSGDADCSMVGFQLDDAQPFADFTFGDVVIVAGGYWLGYEDAEDDSGVSISFKSGIGGGGDTLYLGDPDGDFRSVTTLDGDIGATNFDVNGNACSAAPTPGLANADCYVLGCMDNTAENYNDAATVDDGTCLITTYAGYPALTPTGVTHSIAVPAARPDNLAYISVYYDSDGEGDLKLGGWAEVTTGTFSITAYGDDSTTSEKDGFAANDEFIWRGLTSAGDEVNLMVTVTGNSQFASNGVSTVQTVVIGECQTITLPAGWSMFSTYLTPFEPDIAEVFSNIDTDVVIVKDGAGTPYWPFYNINSIGDMTLGKGYQIKMDAESTLEICGTYAAPESTELSLTNGWDIIGYLRKHASDIAEVFSNIVDNVIIVKDGAGDPYWPGYGINNIGDMAPGQGYQIKMGAQQTLTYAANEE